MNTNTANGLDPAGKVEIAEVNAANINYGLLGSGPNTSPFIPLLGGQRYYMEAWLKEGTGGDGFSMAFRELGDPSIPANTEIAPGYFFESLGN